MTEPEPGRSCPLSYRTRAEDLRGPAEVTAETVYVIGGLYGNHHALGAIEALAQLEETFGLPRPTLIFNGDFNWFNADAESLAHLNDRVLRHHAIQGNVEAELADPNPQAGCGCAYPDWVDDGMVERSNRIIARLQSALTGNETLRQRLAQLPRQLRVAVGECRVGVVHGDPDSIAGWGLAVEHMPKPGAPSAAITDWFERSDVDLLACTHTCLPFLQNFDVGNRRRLVANNGAAGMPNFRGSHCGLLTRISHHPSPHGAVYSTTSHGIHIGAVSFDAVSDDWLRGFEQLWPPGSAAHESYYHRLTQGPDFTPDLARRLL